MQLMLATKLVVALLLMAANGKFMAVIPSFIVTIAVKMGIHSIIVGIYTLTCDPVRTRLQTRLKILKLQVRSLLQIFKHLWG